MKHIDKLIEEADKLIGKTTDPEARKKLVEYYIVMASTIGYENCYDERRSTNSSESSNPQK